MKICSYSQLEWFWQWLKSFVKSAPADENILFDDEIGAVNKHCSHRGEKVQVGSYSIYVGGTNYLKPQDLQGFDFIIPLEPRIPTALGVTQDLRIIGCPWPDFGPPPQGFENFLREKVIPLLKKDKKILVYCIGSHGRTGTFIASLIAILEPKSKTPDPIAVARERHCFKAVETLAQANYVFSLRKKPLPQEYQEEFKPPLTGSIVGNAHFSSLKKDLAEMSDEEIRREFGLDQVLDSRDSQAE